MGTQSACFTHQARRIPIDDASKGCLHLYMNDVYAKLKAHFANDPDVAVTGGKGAQGIKFGKKMFAMFYKGELTVQLSPERVQELIQSGKALPHDPGTGTPMKDRVLVPAAKKASWVKLCEESKRYVMSK